MLIWERRRGDRWLGFTAEEHGHTFTTSIEHGGGWIGMIRGPLDGLVDAKCFYGPERARECRAWLEVKARDLGRELRRRRRARGRRRRGVGAAR